MQKIFDKIPFLILALLFINVACDSFGKDNPKNFSAKHDSVPGNEKLYFETDNVEASDDIIREHLQDRFPIISDDELNSIIRNKTITQNSSVSDSTLTSASSTVYKVSFEVPENFLVDTAKILWELNIPGFQSKIYQLFNGQQIYIDTWPNVVGKASTKTYTGNYQAYRIRNWPFYKDPDPDKKDLSPTPPGPNNPLGLFVVHYDENSLRYFHGTNQSKLLNNKLRNLSHGCVRNDNANIEKMKEFIIRRVVKSEDLSGWLGSKKTLIYDFEESDKFPVRIIYKTFDMDKDETGNYIILFKDVYNYKNSDNIDIEWDDPGLITLTNKENLFSEYRKKFGRDSISGEALNVMLDYLINNGKEYQKYYVDDLKKKFMIQN
jgi:lipoprotein-anchoring transpeptidase ErfK/SrfK